MKKITKPAEREEAVFYSDFSGKILDESFPPVEVKIEFNYGSKRDGASLQLHLDDEDVKPIIDLIKQKMSSDLKEQIKKQLEKQEKDFDDSMQFRDWGSCDYLTNSMWFLRELLDIKEE
jgi:hypothetical protein